jgi:hypothetical protein
MHKSPLLQMAVLALLLLLLLLQQCQIMQLRRQIQASANIPVSESEAAERPGPVDTSAHIARPPIRAKQPELRPTQPITDTEPSGYQQTVDSLQDALRQMETLATEQAASLRMPVRDYLRFVSIGKGVEVYYLGETAEGQANGQGIGIWKSGSRYEGSWRNNQRHGEGTYVWADGESYSGAYVEDRRHGFGTYTTKTGAQYLGMWVNDQREGAGKLIDKSGKLRLQGIWKADKLIKTLDEF